MRIAVPTRARSWSALQAGVVALAVCYFALWACAPLYSAPPPVPVPGGAKHELGLAGGTTITVPGPNGCPIESFWSQSDPCVKLALQAHYRVGYKGADLVLLGHAGALGAGGGLLARAYVFHRPQFRAGLIAGGGLLWAQGGVGIAGRAAPGVWLYTEPTLSVSTAWPVRIPVGARLELGRASVGLEGGLARTIYLGPVYGYWGVALSAGF